MNKILVLGDGLLGTEIVKQTSWPFISRKKNGFDFEDLHTYKHLISDYDVIVNCIAHTKTYSKDRDLHWNINYKALSILADYCCYSARKLVQISTDYLYCFSKENASETDVPCHAVNWYSYTKLLADAYVQLRLPSALIIRTSFKPRPFPYERAIVTQTGNFDYVDIIAGMIIKLIKDNEKGVYNVGTKKKRIFDLATETNPDVIASYEYLDPSMPTDISMDLTKLKEALDE
jgi:dTDP-4-dehydrorhamnose reductase